MTAPRLLTCDERSRCARPGECHPPSPMTPFGTCAVNGAGVWPPAIDVPAPPLWPEPPDPEPYDGTARERWYDDHEDEIRNEGLGG